MSVGKDQRRGRGLGWLLGVLALGVAVVRLDVDGVLREPFPAYADQTFEAVLVARAADPDAYWGDAMVDAMDRVWPDGWFRVLATWCGWFPDLRLAWSVATVLVAAVFLGGLVWLGARLTGDVWVGGVLALATAALPRDSFIGEWAVVPLIPRFVTLAASPWLLGAVVRGRRWPFFVAGLLAWVHALSALHLVACMAAVQWACGGGRRGREFLIGAGLALLGALPAVTDLPHVHGRVDVAALRDTSFAYSLAPPLYKAGLILTNLAVLLGVTVVLWRWVKGTALRRFLCGLAGAAVLLALLHPLAARHAWSLTLSPLRPVKYLFLVLLLAASTGVVGAWRAGGSLRRALAAAGLLGLVLPVGAKAYGVAWHHWSALGRRLDASLEARPELFRPDLDFTGREAELRSFCTEVHRLVPEGDVILAPPRGASVLRLWSRRALFVTAEDSVLALYYQEAFADFRRRYLAARAAYDAVDPAALLELCTRDRLEWLVVEEGTTVAGPVAARGAGLVLVGPLGDS